MRLSNFQRNIIKKIEEQHFDTQIKVKFFLVQEWMINAKLVIF